MSATHGSSLLPAAGLVTDRAGGRRRLRAAIAVTAGVLLVEVVGGLLSGSLALLADAAHVFADIGALTLAYAAATLADRAPTGRHTFGLYRAEVLAAFVNAQVLLLMALFIGYEAVRRLTHPIAIQAGLMLAIGAVALTGNMVSVLLLARGRNANLNMRAAYLEVVMDTLGALAVVAAAVAIPATGWTWIDPALSGAIALVILPRAVGLLRQSAHILLEGTPGEIDVPALRRLLSDVSGVEEVHDLHFWTLTSGLHSASVHIRASTDIPRAELLAAVQRLLQEQAGVAHATIQVEWGSEMTCHASNRGHA
jgi:cobalt-zinc-cadmium efflux system protein